MNNILTRRLAVLILLLAGFSYSGMAQSPSTVGKDFHVMFLRNETTYPASNSLTYFPTLKLIMTGKNACSGTITSTNGSFTKNFTVTPGEITTITIPKNTSSSNPADKQAGFTLKSGYVENKGLHITADDSISLYAVNYLDASFDITNVLPTYALGDEYIIQDYKGVNFGNNIRAAVFAIVATEDGTVVDITPTAKTGMQIPGQSATATYNANQTFSVSLNAGQTYQLIAFTTDAFDGTYVKARDCKKIAVFQGNTIAPLPGNVNAKKYYGYEDHLFEQSIPTKYWGKNFIVTQSLQRANDRVKVTALNDGCTVKINGTQVKTLAARETYEFEIVKDHAADTVNAPIDKVYGPAHYIETSDPASVFLFLTSREYSSNTSTEQIGDPSMVLVTPVEQQIDYVTFSTFETDRVKIHHANIITETNNVSGMKLDGASIASAFSPVPGNTAYSYARIDLAHGSHTLQNPSGGFSAHVYGFGQTAGKDESYAYTVGTGVKDLNKNLFINGTNVDDIAGYFESCNDENINFEVTTNMPFSSIEWIFGDGSSTSSNGTTTHAYADAGEVELLAVIHWENNDCSLTDTLRATMSIDDCTPPVPSGCVEITDLKADFITCSIGQSDAMNPFQYNNQIRDYGENDERSRHTIVDTLTGTDPRTNGGLTYRPPGENYSIRLGNWLTGHNSEAITINMLVDSVDAPIVILKYACVMQNPQIDHSPEQQPRFSFRVLDSNDGLIDPDCMSADFIAGSSLSGWHTTTYQNEPLLWKDWTTIGIDVSAYHGQTIKIQIINRDCQKGDHFGYSYFHLSCAQKNLVNNVCGIADSFTFTAPVGFNYKWFFTDAPGTILSTSQTATIETSGNIARTLCCRCIFKENSSCYFDIFTKIQPTAPVPSFSYSSQGCSPVVQFTNTSTVSPGGGQCESAYWDFGDGTTSTEKNPTHTYSTTGDFVVTLTAAINNGECAETTSQTINIGATAYHEEYATDCNVITWEEHTCDTTGVYVHTYHNASGCDSIVTLHFTRTEISVGEFSVEDCKTYYWNGQPYSSSGDYEQNFETGSGCDSTAILHFTFTPAAVGEFEVEDCKTYYWNGQPYSSSGDYEQNFETASGCDSTAILHFTFTPAAVGEFEVEDCKTYYWNGQPYSASGDYEQSFETASGCDSVAIMHFTFTPAATSEFYAEDCKTYYWNDQPYSASGDYQQNFETASGCDSVAILHFTFTPAATGEFYAEDCKTYYWNDQPYSASGDYQQNFETLDGCDSVAILHFTFTPAAVGEFSVEDCKTYYWNGQPYATSGDYQQNFETASGCDSTAILHLTISSVIETVENVSACDSYIWNGVELTQSGTYQEHFTTESQCDSISTLNLDIQAGPASDIDGELRPVGGSETFISNYTYKIIPHNSNAHIDSVQWFIGCPNWQLYENGDFSCDLYIHTYISDSVELRAVIYNECGVATESVWLHTSYFGIDEVGFADISIIPNPNNGTMRIALDGVEGLVDVRIYDVTGNITDAFTTSGGSTISYHADLAPSIYNFVFNTSRGTVIRKVVIER